MNRFKFWAMMTGLFCIAHPTALALLTNYGFTFSNDWFCYPTLAWFILSGILLGIGKITG